MKKLMDLTGQKYGRLTVVSEAERHVQPSGQSKRIWLCECECGNKVSIPHGHLRNNHTQSCSCLLKEGHITHGLHNTRLYSIWSNIKTRTTNTNNDRYSDYGGRGIKMCDEWYNDFKTFYDWAMSNGYSDKYQIDRRDNEKGYSSGNCRFVTCRVNILNQRLLISSNKSGYRGVSFYKKNKKWESKITINKKKYYLGRYATVEQAVEARNQFIIDNNLQHEYKIQEIK